MASSNLIQTELAPFFKALEEHPYIAIRMSQEFPLVSKGSDIDLLCKDKEETAQILLATANKIINADRHVRVATENEHVHIDIFINGGLDIRFDLIEDIAYKKQMVSSNFIDHLIKNPNFVHYQDKEKAYKVRIPDKIDDGVLRTFELMEYAHKTHHEDWLNNLSAIEREQIRKKMRTVAEKKKARLFQRCKKSWMKYFSHIR